MSFFRGTSVDQDARFFSQNKKLLAKLSFPKSFDQRVDLTKVKREVIGQWITERVTQLLGFEDDIVVAMIINLLEPKVDEPLDPRQMQLTLTGFLEKDAPAFMKELWALLLSAQAHPTGIPPAILEKKKQEMAQAAQDKRQLRDVLDRKRQDAAASATTSDTLQRPRQDLKQYGLSHPGGSSARGGRKGGAADRGRERGGRRREERRRASPPRSRRPRSPSRSRSRSRSHSRSPSRSRSRRRSPPRSPSRSPSRSRRRRARRSPSRSKSRERTRGSRARRSPSRSRERGRRRDRRRSPSPRNRGRDRSPLSRSRSPSADQFGRQRRRTLSKSPSRSRQEKKRGRSRSAS